MISTSSLIDKPAYASLLPIHYILIPVCKSTAFLIFCQIPRLLFTPMVSTVTNPAYLKLPYGKDVYKRQD